MKRYWTLLQNEPLLRRLSIIQLIAYFGAWFSNVAIYTLLIQLHVSATTIALVAALHFFAGVLQAPLSGVIIDRFSPKKLMILLTLTEISATLGLLLIHDISQLIWLYGLVFIRMGAASFQFTVEMSLLPRVLEGKALQYANEIHSVIWSFSYTAGMALGGAVVYYIGTTYAFLLDASLFMIVLMLLFTLTISVNIEKQHQTFVTMMGDAFRYIRQNKIVLHLMLLHAVVGFTAFDALVVLSVKQYYMDMIAVSLGIGLVHASRAIGLTIGPLFLGEWVTLERLRYLFVAEGLTIILWAIVIEHFYLSLLASVLVGLVTTTLWSYTYTLLQHHTQSDYYGRIVAYNDMIFLIVGGFVSLLIGFLVDIHIPLAIITVILGGAFLVAAFYYGWIRHHYTLFEIGHQ
ncbi:MAG: MFS transporter [Sulfuricurvum sp.]|uniref:MFS transporter n=1 Tax=Sulfuricurvum sp. TaxID=2025608 RepID=UPI002611D5DB|nr:MFS transporter [Sulfuricurvum sp.]MDD2828926.1 MFS transporter [Sulfuricurvum sp.]MDD4948589.1 MFS transporter [Sulfuricurvum sp.]